MPALVDNPIPSLADFSRITPLSYPSANIQQTSPSSNPPSPLTPDDSTPLPMSHPRSHGKRRDPSYIPRPSNAFILFRSAFIRDRKVSDKVEGNHSSLSKIIGHSWKKLSPKEREKWEAEAVAAQAQHRAMYPDWRFRPGANALAKLKIKDGGSTMRRRSSRVKDHPPDDEAAHDELVDAEQGEKRKVKEKGKNKPSARMLSLRCAKIADFVAEGIRGEELEVAVKQWEGDRKMGKEKPQRPRLSRTRAASSASTHARSNSYTTMSDNHYPNDSPPPTSNPSPQHSALKPAAYHSSLSSGVPLTHMFKRSLISSSTATTSFDAQYLTWQDAENQRRLEEMQEPNSWWGESRLADIGYQRASRITELGYDNCGASYFDCGYVEYASYDSPHDASRNVEWTNNTDRHGLVTELHNLYEYEDSSNPTSPHTPTLPAVYAPSLSDSYYYAQSSPLPPSSFSTLTGWAGDYKTDPSSTSAPLSSSSSTTSSSNWYLPESTFNWSVGGRFEHGQCSTLDSQDWDRVEYRTATDFHLAVEPLRPMTFHDEIYRLYGSSP